VREFCDFIADVKKGIFPEGELMNVVSILFDRRQYYYRWRLFMLERREANVI